jgi:hypothetical protein
MADSWRDILENAAASLSIDLNRARPGQVQFRPSIQGMRRRSPVRSYSSAEARDLLERELEAISARPIDDRPASVVDSRRAVKQRARTIDDRPASVDSTQAVKQRNVPRTSLMAAINAATPAAPAVSERSTAQILPKRLPWRSFLAISLSATIIGLSAHALLNRGGRDVDTSVTRHATPTTVLDGVLVSVPLPSRRPSNLRGEQSRDRSSSSSAGNGSR